jgi:hypothetical protein
MKRRDPKTRKKTGQKDVLVKRVCMACFVQFYGPDAGFSKNDHRLWREKHVVQCPYSGSVWSITAKPPPDNCPYRLEMIMEKQ